MVGKLNGPTPSIAPGALPARFSTPPQSASAGESATSVQPPAATVKLSGHAMMLSRLFQTTDPGAEPAVEYEVTPANAGGDVYPFLQHQDRDALAKAYDFATESGIDPSIVDAVARDLALHRSSSPALDALEPSDGDLGVGSEKKAELARAVSAYRMMPGSPEDRERYASTTSQMLQSHLSSGGTIDFEYVRGLLTLPKE